MEFHTDVYKKFLVDLPRYEPLVLDHSAIKTYKECPRKFFYRYVLGYVLKGSSAPYFVFGRCYHRFREIQTKVYIELLNKNPNATRDDKLAFQSTAGAQALGAALESWKKSGYVPDPAHKFGFLDLPRLIETCKYAHKHWCKEINTGIIEVLFAEQPFQVALPDGRSTNGRFDEVVKWRGELWGRDFKSGSKKPEYFKRSLEPNDQSIRYTYAEGLLAGERVKGQIIEYVYNAPSTGRGKEKKQVGPEIHTFTVEYSPFQVQQWLEGETKFWRENIDRSRQLDLYPMSENNCGWCDYHDICKRSSEFAMKIKLQQNYVVEIWDNTKTDD